MHLQRCRTPVTAKTQETEQSETRAETCRENKNFGIQYAELSVERTHSQIRNPFRTRVFSFSFSVCCTAVHQLTRVKRVRTDLLMWRQHHQHHKPVQKVYLVGWTTVAPWHRDTTAVPQGVLSSRRRCDRFLALVIVNIGKRAESRTGYVPFSEGCSRPACFSRKHLDVGRRWQPSRFGKKKNGVLGAIATPVRL